MQLLQITKQFPYPLKDGYSVAVTAIAKSLVDNDLEVDLLAMNTTKHFFDLSKLPKHFNGYRQIFTQKVNNNITPWGAFFNLFSPVSYILSRFINANFEEELIQILQKDEYDFIQLESVQLAPYIPIIRKYSKAKVAMRTHNVEFEIWERHVATTRFPLKKWYLQSQLKSFKQFEIQQLRNYDLLISITQKDLESFEKLGFSGKSIVIPVGMDLKKYQFSRLIINPEKLQFSFIGSMDWMPNQEGVRWFLDNIWESVVSKYPAAEFKIAGRHVPDWLRKMETNSANFLGEVDSAIDFISEFPIMVVPLFSGSGIRVKILEALALGRVVLTTTLGAEGIDAKHRESILIADSPEAFLEEIEFCYQNSEKLIEIGRQARLFIEEHFDNFALGKKLQTMMNDEL